ncbi:solute carrier family 23 protein, partial [Staphylococcus epidermidis]|uniref:solute carrier family 23 protein n=1 Tax=Staphylococcus epidermidis TaxID=1282 RepID=UPI0037DA514D
MFPILHIKQLPHPHSFRFPLPFTFSPFPFHLTSILLFFILPLLTLIQSTPLYHPLTQITPTKLQTKHFRKPYTPQRLPIILPSIFNPFPYTPYSQNLPLLSLSPPKNNNLIYP